MTSPRLHCIKIFAALRQPRSRPRIEAFLSSCLVLLAGAIYLALAIRTPPWPIGEFYSYMLPMVSLEKHFSGAIYEADLEQAKIDFPEFAKYFDGRRLSRKDGKWYPLYCPTYSLACIPAKTVLRVAGFSQTRATIITNALVYTLALTAIMFFLKTNIYARLCLFFLCAFHPAILYLFWSSAEVFIFSVLIVSCTLLWNRKYVLSAVFLSIAGSLNVTIFLFLPCLLIMFLYEKNWATSGRFALKTLLAVRVRIADVVLIMVSVGCGVAGFLWAYKSHLARYSNSSGVVSRFIAYLLDLNLGFLPYFPLLFPLVLATMIFTRKRWRMLIYLGAFLSVVLGYSYMHHINSGMTGISRYGAWSSIFLIFSIVSAIDMVISSSVKRFLLVSAYGSSILTALILIWSTHADIISGRIPMMGGKNTKIASLVLDNAPCLYSPLLSTFVSRVACVDGGYQIPDNPTIYFTADGLFRKALVSEPRKDEIFAYLSGDRSAMVNLSNELKSLRFDRTPEVGDKDKYFAYINFNGTQIRKR